MAWAELFLVAVGLSMDAFAVSICKGLGMKRIDMRQALIIALFFGGFQALMPLIGWGLGSGFQHIIAPIDHWVAFGLLALIGGKMLWEGLRGSEGDDDGPDDDDELDIRELLMLAIATSIDALAVGITFAFLQVEVVPAVCLIGVTTFVLSLIGVGIGSRFGARFERPATTVGGIVLILIGVQILFEHLGVIIF